MYRRFELMRSRIWYFGREGVGCFVVFRRGFFL